MTSLLLPLSFCTLTVCGFLIASAPIAHWFVVPVWLCEVLIGRDAVDWFRRRLGLFDPARIIGLIGVHLFFLASLLRVPWHSWLHFVEPPPDWRPWVGGMAVVHAAGLLPYRAAREKAMASWISCAGERRSGSRSRRTRSASWLNLLGSACEILIAWRDRSPLRSGIFLQEGDLLHYHLSGSGAGGRIPGGNNPGLLEAAVRGAARGARIFHPGGGVGSLPDSLFAFKASVGNRRAEYWTGQRIFDPVSLGQFCEARGKRVAMNGSNFPAYRVPQLPGISCAP